MPAQNGETHNASRTTAVVPVKRFDAAHERLAASVSQPDRARLAEALFHDLVSKIRRCKRIDQTLIVTADGTVARHARWLGHEVLLQEEDPGHSQAAAAGARLAAERGFGRVAMLPVDCPLLDPHELDSRLGQIHRAALIVPDHHGTGTNALVLSPPTVFSPAFGPDSCARHVSRARAAGVSFAMERIESLALDLDTEEDLLRLRDALIIDPQPAVRTAQVLWELGPELEPAEPTAA